MPTNISTGHHIWFALKYFYVEPRLWYLHQQQFNIWPAWATVIRKEFIRHVRASKKVSRYNFVGLEWASAARQWWSTGQARGMLREAEIRAQRCIWTNEEDVLSAVFLQVRTSYYRQSTQVSLYLQSLISVNVKRDIETLSQNIFIVPSLIITPLCPRGLVSIQAWH